MITIDPTLFDLAELASNPPPGIVPETIYTAARAYLDSPRQERRIRHLRRRVADVTDQLDEALGYAAGRDRYLQEADAELADVRGYLTDALDRYRELADELDIMRGLSRRWSLQAARQSVVLSGLAVAGDYSAKGLSIDWLLPPPKGDDDGFESFGGRR